MSSENDLTKSCYRDIGLFTVEIELNRQKLSDLTLTILGLISQEQTETPLFSETIVEQDFVQSRINVLVKRLNDAQQLLDLLVIYN